MQMKGHTLFDWSVLVSGGLVSGKRGREASKKGRRRFTNDIFVGGFLVVVAGSMTFNIILFIFSMHNAAIPQPVPLRSAVPSFSSSPISQARCNISLIRANASYPHRRDTKIPRNLTLIFGTRGELANHLNSIAHALRIKHWIELEYPHLTVLLQAEHREDKQWFTVAPVLTRCFPVLRDNIEFWEGGKWMNRPAFTIESPVQRNDASYRKMSFLRRKLSRFIQLTIASIRYFATVASRWFVSARTSRYHTLAHIQAKWLTSRGFASDSLHMESCCPLNQTVQNSLDIQCWRRKLCLIQQMHDEQDTNIAHNPIILDREPAFPTSEDRLKYVSLPFLRTDAWSTGRPFDEAHYKLVRTWFAMNESDPECCPHASQLPRPGEIVWHYRNFRGEDNKYVTAGLVEVTPDQAVDLLFKPIAANKMTQNIISNHETSIAPLLLKPHNQSSKNPQLPQKIALLSRFAEDLEPVVHALARVPTQFETRVIQNGTAASDFCFLRNTRHILVGFHLSTYAGWSAILGNSQVLLYIVNHTYTRRRADQLKRSFLSNIGYSVWIRQNARFHLTIIPE